MKIQKVKEWKSVQVGAQFKVLWRDEGEISIVSRISDEEEFDMDYQVTLSGETFFIDRFDENLINVWIYSDQMSIRFPMEIDKIAANGYTEDKRMEGN
jgi:hypothetical protein